MHYAIDKVLLAFLLLAGLLGQAVTAVEQESSGNTSTEQADEFGSDTGLKNTRVDEKPAGEENEEPECD